MQSECSASLYMPAVCRSKPYVTYEAHQLADAAVEFFEENFESMGRAAGRKVTMFRYLDLVLRIDDKCSGI